MKKRIVAAIIALTVVCTGAAGMIGVKIGGNIAKHAAGIEKSIELEELQAKNDDVLAEMRTEKINALLGEKDAKTAAADQKTARQVAEAGKTAADRAAKELKKAEILNTIREAKEDGTITEEEAGTIRGMLNEAKAQKLVITFTYGDLDDMDLSLEELKGLKINVVDEFI